MDDSPALFAVKLTTSGAKALEASAKKTVKVDPGYHLEVSLPQKLLRSGELSGHKQSLVRGLLAQTRWSNNILYKGADASRYRAVVDVDIIIIFSTIGCSCALLRNGFRTCTFTQAIRSLEGVPIVGSWFPGGRLPCPETPLLYGWRSFLCWASSETLTSEVMSGVLFSDGSCVKEGHHTMHRAARGMVKVDDNGEELDRIWGSLPQTSPAASTSRQSRPRLTANCPLMQSLRSDYQGRKGGPTMAQGCPVPT